MKFLSVLIGIFLLTSCMLLLNLTLEDGVYVVGDWNDWQPSPSDKMECSGEYCIFNLPVSSMTFSPSNGDPTSNIAWYKVIVVSSGNTVVSSSIPVWKENLDANVLTIYASPSLMEDGTARGVGDSEKSAGDWYVAGSFNGWKLVKMEFDGRFFTYTAEVSGKSGDVVEYKIARGEDWKPYETQYDGEKYNAGYGENARYVAHSDYSKIVIRFDPKLSILEMEAIP